MNAQPPPLYTRAGDGGETTLPGGRKMAKTAALVEVLGVIDELNGMIGITLAHPAADDVRSCLRRVQHQLFALGADLAGGGTARISDTQTAWLERRIDDFTAAVSPLTAFILPGGTPAAAHCHVARSVCRRAERRLVALGRESSVPATHLKYMNRLSDLLFAAARRLNHWAGQEETKWSKEIC